ncbi:uncharacterized protein ACNLHF_007040 [Anomaloglossus baeobatrachus]
MDKDSPWSALPIVWFGLSIASLVLGVIHKDDCPYQPYVPIYMMVSGIVEAVACLIIPLKLFYEKVHTGIQFVLFTFNVCWLIPGGIWIFHMYEVYKVDCDNTVYFFTFSVVIIKCVIFGISILMVIVACYKAFAESIKERANPPEIPT